MLRYLVFWIVCSFAASGPLLLSQLSQNDTSSLVTSLDRQWLSWKTKTLNRFNPKSPNKSVRILRLQYDNPIEFWLDTSIHQKFLKKLSQYRGPILLNLSPSLLESTPSLKPILSQKNLIRPFEVRAGMNEYPQLEKLISEKIKNPELSRGSLIELLPKKPQYFSDKYFYGDLSYEIDSVSRSIVSFSLLRPGSRYVLPSMSLSAFQMLRQCSVARSEESLLCSSASGEIAIPENIDLYFYKRSLLYYEHLNDLPNSNGPLLVHIDTGLGGFLGLTGKKMDWAELQGTVLSNLLESHFWKKSSAYSLYEYLGLFLFFLLFSFFVWRTNLRSTLTFFLAFLAAYVCIDLVAAFHFGLRTHPTDKALSMFVLAIAGLSLRAVNDSKERSLLERAFSGYVSSERLTGLLSGKESLELKGRRQKLSIMILDLVGFSSICEKIQPEESFEILKQSFESIDRIIFSEHGVIDKKLGDGLIAFFGDNTDELDPEESYRISAQSAVDAAIRIQEEFRHISFQEIKGAPKIQLRIGINSGEVLLGNAGSELHFDYTVLGSPVNYTQRLEAACKPGNVLLGESTHRLVKVRYPIEERTIVVKNDPNPHQSFEIQI